MKRLPFILRKEFIQIFRNKSMLPLIFIVPIIQMIILVNAADFTISNLHLSVIDMDHSPESRTLISHFKASPFFELKDQLESFDQGMAAIDKGEIDLLLRIPDNFSESLNSRHPTSLMIDVDGIDGQKSNLSYFYTANIIQQYNREQLREKLVNLPIPGGIEISQRFWYNPELDYSNLMVPGLLAVLVTMVGLFLSSMNIVREKEIGTIEQLNVTPISKPEFVVGKLLPFWIISMFELAFGLLVGKLVFHIPVEGSLFVLFSFTAVYLVVMLGLGLLISTFTHTQQQAMFLSWFFMVIFILMGGLFTPIENMPEWARKITLFNPVSYFIEVLRLVLLKGSGFKNVMSHFGIMALMAVVVNVVAVLNYRKRAS